MTYLTGKTGVVSTNNSTTTALVAHDSWTGATDDVHNYSSIGVTIRTNRPSANLGVVIEFSSDNTNWDICIENSMSGKKYRVFRSSVKAKYFRLKFENGSVDQTYLRIQTIFHKTKSGSASKMLGVDTYIKDQMKGTIISGIRTDEARTLVDLDTHLAPIQINAQGELRTDTTELVKMRILLGELVNQQKLTNMYLQTIIGEEFDLSDIA